MKTRSKRRQHGTGSVFRKPPCKKWVIQFYKDGRRIREATGLTEWAEAQKLLRQRLHEVDKQEYIARQGKPARVEDLYEMLEEHTRINRPKGVSSLGRRWKHLGPVFGAMRAGNVTTDDVRRYTLQRKEAKAENATVNRELSALKRMFRLGLQTTPPKVRVVPYIPMLEERNVRTGFVEKDGFARLAFAAEGSEAWLRVLVEMGYTYGWRKSELLGLLVRQVDLRARTIRLDVGSTKNGEGREVAMTEKIVELLQVAVAGKRPEDFVFTRANGKPIKSFRGAWYKLCISAGLGQKICCQCSNPVTEAKCDCGGRRFKYLGLIPHDLRRSAAKALRAAGVPESVTMKIGGWKTASVFRRYAIVSEADQRAAVEMLERHRAEKSPLSAPFATQAPNTLASTREPKVQ